MKFQTPATKCRDSFTTQEHRNGESKGKVKHLADKYEPKDSVRLLTADKKKIRAKYIRDRGHSRKGKRSTLK